MMEEIEKVKENILKRETTDRIMWFSMWFLLSIITFGLALFPMFYFLVKRRNSHFLRQREFEKMVLSILKDKGLKIQVEPDNIPERNALLWALAIPLLFPVFVVLYYLSEDLIVHEKRQIFLFNSIFPRGRFVEQKLNLKFCMAITLVTLGVGVIYWLYKVFNAYNNHFKEQWKVEDKIIQILDGECLNEHKC